MEIVLNRIRFAGRMKEECFFILHPVGASSILLAKRILFFSRSEHYLFRSPKIRVVVRHVLIFLLQVRKIEGYLQIDSDKTQYTNRNLRTRLH